MGDENNTNAAIPSKLKIQNSDMLPSAKSINVAIPVDQTESTSHMLIYKMYWKNPMDSLIFFIKNAAGHLGHVIYIRKKEHPTDDIYDWKKSIDTNDWISNDEINVMVNGGLYTEATLVYISVSVSSNITGS